MPECSFHVGYKWVVVNVSMTHGGIFEGKIFCVRIGGPLRQVLVFKLKVSKVILCKQARLSYVSIQSEHTYM